MEVNTGQIPGQMNVSDIPGVQPEQGADVALVDGKSVDTETGEIIEEAQNNVIDLRAKQA